MIFWKKINKRLKRKLSYADMRKRCIKHANAGRKTKLLSTALATLTKIDSSKDWFWQWQLYLSPSLKRIADANSHEAQALQSRVEIMENLQRFAKNSILLNLDISYVKDFMLILEHSDVPTLSKSERESRIILNYTFCLLTDISLALLYEDKFERYLPLDDFTKPYNAICRAYFKIHCYTSFWNEVLIESKDPGVQSTATIYLDNISSRMLNVLCEAKEDFEAWIKASHVDGIESYKARLLKLAEEYSDAHESVQKAIETWPEYIKQKDQNGL